jgi:hypothetical protein
MPRALARALAADDRRIADRVSVSLRGKVFPGQLDCTVADFSKFGARLKFEQAPPTADRLTMVVWSSGVAFDAQVRWRRGAELGVQFCSNRDLRRPAPPHLVEIQALWMKRRPRVGRRQLIASPVILQQRPRSSRRSLPPLRSDS